MSYYDFDHSILDIANDFYEAYKRCAEGKVCIKQDYIMCFGGATMKYNLVNIENQLSALFENNPKFKPYIGVDTKVY